MKPIFKTLLLALACALPVASPSFASANTLDCAESASLTVPPRKVYLLQPDGSYLDSTSTTFISGASLFDLNGNFIGTLFQNEEGGGQIRGISGDTIGYFTPAT